jgi:secondary thiamine-phosphate synthase enzyme
VAINIEVRSRSRNEFIDITEQVRQAIKQSGLRQGLCVVYVPHTTAGVTINEGADPSVQDDIMRTLNKLIPLHGDYRHSEGNSDAHIKTSLLGSSVTLLVENGGPVLGTWQAVFLGEFDGPRHRKVLISTLSSSG